MHTGEWYWSTDHNQVCKVMDVRSLWGETSCRVWLPSDDTVVTVRPERLKPLAVSPSSSPQGIAYAVAAARIVEALNTDLLVAPIESSIIPLPHQIKVLSRAISEDRVRYLLADEVGLGKTIEAGLILRELKLRGLVTRTLVIAPKGLVTQWVAEMRTHFNEDFHLVLAEDMKTLRRLSACSMAANSGTDTREQVPAGNAWTLFSQVICPMDTVKPLEGRRGLSQDQVAEHNRERFENLLSAGWDLVIVDEAHRLGGSTEQVARYRLGQALAKVAPYVLLLTATPHQGKTDAFHRLISLLDPEAFPDPRSVSRDRVRPYVIRTEKRRAIDAQGKPLFKPRQTQLIPVDWKPYHSRQRLLYDAVTEYVRKGYNQAVREKKSYIGFLMILVQRLVVSSTRSIRTTLERRLQVLQTPEGQMALFPVLPEDEWPDLDGQEQVDTLLRTRIKALDNEKTQVELLLDAAKQCEQASSDAKAETLLDWIYRLQQEEADADLKVLIFTEFVPTQEMLRDFLTERGFSVVCLNGSMDMEERKRAETTFATKARILVSTDAGGEGLNLQFCHVVINYDIPWNPMRLEQRIGRVDRIGQSHVVRALNFVLQDSVEHRVQEVLERKLAVILKEFGVDKSGDVLDSAQAEQLFDDLYIKAILDPGRIESSVDEVVAEIMKQAREMQESASLLDPSQDVNPDEAQRLISHPLPYWVERMTVSYLNAYGGHAERRKGGWSLNWPDGASVPLAVFTFKEAQKRPAARHITLEDPRVRRLASTIPPFAPGQPVPVVRLDGIPREIAGIWSLWRISLHSTDWSKERVFPLFLHEEGRRLAPTARMIWDRLLAGDVEITGFMADDEASAVVTRLWPTAELDGKPIYDELVRNRQMILNRERVKGEQAFDARRRLIQGIGLPAVKRHREEEIDREERLWRGRLDNGARLNPDLIPLVILRIEVA